MSSIQGHGRPDLLVETEWLAEYLNDPQLRVVDMGPADGYKRGHITGAIALDRDYFKDETNPVYVMPPDQFERMMSRVGIDNDSHVVAYDEYGGLYAARLWWVLRLYGHEQVWVLNGGWNKWLKEGRPWEQIPITGYHSEEAWGARPGAKFVAKTGSSLNCSIDRILDNLSDPNFVTLDVRSDGEYNGTLLRGNRRGGHIPGTVHIEWSKMVTNDGLRTFRTPGEIRKMLEEAGITPEKDVVTY